MNFGLISQELFSNSKVRFGLILASLILIGGNIVTLPLTPNSTSSNDAVIWVNGYPIDQNKLNTLALKKGFSDFDNLDENLKKESLKLAIDEELLFQRAMSMQLTSAESGIRKSIIRASMDVLIDTHKAKSISQDDLLSYYERNRKLFEQPARYKVRYLKFSNEDQANSAYKMLVDNAQVSTEEFYKIGSDHGALGSVRMRDELVPIQELRKYLGPTLSSMIQSMEGNNISNPINHLGESYLLNVVELKPSRIPDFNDLKEIVESEYRRRESEIVLERALVKLKKDSDIKISIPESVFNENIDLSFVTNKEAEEG